MISMETHDYDDVAQRLQRRRIWERFERALFVGIILTAVLLAPPIVLSQFKTPEPALPMWDPALEQELNAILPTDSAHKVESGNLATPTRPDFIQARMAWADEMPTVVIDELPAVNAKETQNLRASEDGEPEIGVRRVGGQQGDLQAVYKFPDLVWGLRH